MLHHNQNMLIIISGLPGSGKSTLARAFTRETKAIHLNSDILRRELGLMGKYSSADKALVYSTLRKQCHEALMAGAMVVVDSTFYKESIREPFRRLAEACHVPIFWVEIKAQEATIRDRIAKPRPDSEADFSVYEKIRDAEEPLQEPHLVLWSDAQSLNEMVEALDAFIHQPPSQKQSS